MCDLCKVKIIVKKKKFMQFVQNKITCKIEELVKSLFGRHPGEGRGPEHSELTGFQLSPE
jgi:hypothetical protein